MKPVDFVIIGFLVLILIPVIIKLVKSKGNPGCGGDCRNCSRNCDAHKE